MHVLRSLICWLAVPAGVLVPVLATVPARAVTIDMVTVGDPGNAADPATGGLYGAVNYEYKIGKYEVTISQYTDFLNAVAASDPYGLYDARMGSDLTVAGIAQSGTSGNFSYTVISPSGVTPAGASSPGNRPIANVNWFNAARFANWMTNGQGSSTTESGAYTISTGQITAASRTNGVNTYTLSAPSTLAAGDQVAVSGLVGSGFSINGIVNSVSGTQFTVLNALSDATATGTGTMTAASATAASGAAFRIPTENEWYKAAYYSPNLNSGAGGYFDFATQSSTAPGNAIGSGANEANYLAANGFYAVTQSSSLSATQNYLTDVGAFANSESFYGTVDQSGNLLEWNEAIAGTAPQGQVDTSRGYRGGWWGSSAAELDADYRNLQRPQTTNESFGFRVASPVPVPEPSTLLIAAAGLACGAGAFLRRRRKGLN